MYYNRSDIYILGAYVQYSCTFTRCVIDIRPVGGGCGGEGLSVCDRDGFSLHHPAPTQFPTLSDLCAYRTLTLIIHLIYILQSHAPAVALAMKLWQTTQRFYPLLRDTLVWYYQRHQ